MNGKHDKQQFSDERRLRWLALHMSHGTVEAQQIPAGTKRAEDIIEYIDGHILADRHKLCAVMKSSEHEDIYKGKYVTMSYICGD